MTDKERVLIFDTTLRDGEQSAGTSMTVDEKLEVARQLDRLGVDIIAEAAKQYLPEADAGFFDW